MVQSDSNKEQNRVCCSRSKEWLRTMGLLLELQHKLKDSLALIVMALLFLYFSFYTINGERGLLRYLYLNKEIEYARQVAEQYHNEKNYLEQRVHLLSSGSLDLDLLEERSRIVLNFVAKDEFIILDKENNL